jgi:uncharacterized protein (TIGR03437 family)
LKHPVSGVLGGIPAVVLFAGLAQVNFRVPDLAPGDYALIVNVRDIPSNTARFRVAAPVAP